MASNRIALTDMKRPIDNITPLRLMEKTIEADYYNHVRLALMRISNPLRVALPGHRGLEIILHDSYWFCIDSLNDDQPIMAWCDFDTSNHNKALHHPVTCRLCLYHMHAGLIMGSALEGLDQILVQKLDSLRQQTV